MKIKYLISGLCCFCLPLFAQSTSFPAPKTLGPIETYGRHIQRTMTLLATSTPQHSNPVKILFYGQSLSRPGQKSWLQTCVNVFRTPI